MVIFLIPEIWHYLGKNNKLPSLQDVLFVLPLALDSSKNDTLLFADEIRKSNNVLDGLIGPWEKWQWLEIYFQTQFNMIIMLKLIIQKIFWSFFVK